LVRAYRDTYELPITITNCANNFGPYHDPEKLFPRFITNLIDGKPVQIYGDGKYVRDWLYVEDHCSAIDLVLEKGSVGETYLIGSMIKEVDNLEFAQKLLKIFNLDDSYIKYVKDRPGHDRRYAIDSTKIRKLGWEPKHDFDTWLGKTVDWYKDNEWWWRPLKAKAEELYQKTGQI
jgi:dTDP-glucose 4,6-dehydratase